MIGIDTNVLLRLFVEDNPDQARVSRVLVADAPAGGVFVAQLTILETFWVLRRSFRWKRDGLIRFLTAMLDLPAFQLENRVDLEEAADRFLLGIVDFGDCVIEVANERAGVSTIYTFDGKASDRRLFTLLKSKV